MEHENEDKVKDAPVEQVQPIEVKEESRRTTHL